MNENYFKRVRISGLTLKANLCIFSIMPFAMNRAIIKTCWKSPTKLQGLEALKARKDYWIGGNGLENLNFSVSRWRWDSFLPPLYW